MVSTGSHLSTNAPKVKNSKKIQSKREIFLSTYHRVQPWSLSDPVIYYITKNSSSVKAYQKCLQTCKHFFIQNPLLVVSFWNLQKNVFWWNFKCIKNCKNETTKIWLTEKLDVQYHSKQMIRSSIIPKIYQCDIRKLYLSHEKIFFDDLKFLGFTCDYVWLHSVPVTKEDNSIIELENVFRVFSRVKTFKCILGHDLGHEVSNIITSKTVVELLKIPLFLNLTALSLTGIPEIFDIQLFYDYIKKNRKTKICISFCNEISNGYKSDLQIMINEIIEKEYHNFKVPIIDFLGVRGFSIMSKFYSAPQKSF